MTYLGRCSVEGQGFILVDVMIALALSAVIVSGMTSMSIEARDIYERASLRAALVRAYEMHSGEFSDLMPYESRSYAVGTSTDMITIVANARWYGNERIETDIEARMSGASVGFVAIRDYPFASAEDVEGSALCSPELSSGSVSERPEAVAVVLPIDPSLPLTDIEVRGDTAYMTADSSVPSDPDLIIADISDPRFARVISVLDTGPGLRSLAIAGRYVYAAAASTAAQLHVIRLDSLSSPVLIKKYRLPTPTPSTTPAMASSISYDMKKVYLGTEKWAGDEFQAIDVSDPASPVSLGGFDVDSKVNAVMAHGSTSWVASANRDQIQELSIADPTHIAPVSSLSPSGWERQEGQALAYFEDSMVAGRTSGGFDIAVDHELFAWPNGSSTPISLNMPGGVYGIIADRNHLYVATRDIDRELTVLSRTMGSSTVGYLSLPVAPQALACDNDRLFILARNSPVIYEITIQPRSK